MAAVTLLASAPTVAALETLVNRFWMSDKYRIDPQTLALSHTEGRTIPPRAKIQQRRGRYRFVMADR